MEVLFEAVESSPPPPPFSSLHSLSVEHDIANELRLQMRNLELKVNMLRNTRTHDLRDDLSALEARLLARLLASQNRCDIRFADLEARLHEHVAAAAAVEPLRQYSVQEENTQPWADTAREALTELQSKMTEITYKLSDIEDMRRKLEDSLLAFEDEKNSLRESVLLINDPKVQDNQEDHKTKETPSLQSKQGSCVKKRTWHSRVPNLYKKINAENTGYDPTHAHIEKRFTILTFVGILVCLFIMTMIFSSHAFTKIVKVEHPSLSDYLDIMSLSNRVGSPECPCEFPIMTWGNAAGFVDGVSYDLDSWCKPRPGPLDIFKEVSIHGIGGPNKTKKHVKAVNITISGMTPSDVKMAEVLGAYISYVYETVRNRLDYMVCPVADDILNKSLNAYLHEFYVSDSLATQDALIKTVKQHIMAMAYNAGLVFQTGLLTEEELLLMSTNPTTKFVQLMGDVQPLNLHDYAVPCLQVAPLPCTQAPGIGPGMMIVQCCLVGDYYSLQCYSRGAGGPGNHTSQSASEAKNACADRLGDSETEHLQCTVLQLPCTEPLKDLAQRYNLSEYRHIADGVKSSMLTGMSAESQEKRTATLSGLPPGSRRLSTDTTKANVGYLWTYSEAATFSRYYNQCKPLHCQYTIQQEKIYGMFYVLTGLVGGIISGFKLGCGCLASMSRKASKLSAAQVDAATIIG